MKKSLLKWQVLGFIFVGIFGVVLHFLYEWTGNSVIVAPFSAVNESVFEHMKLLFFPMLLFAFIEGEYIGKHFDNFWCVKLVGTVTAVLLVSVLFYTLNGAFGKIPDWVNIAIFFVASAIGLVFEIKLMNDNIIACKSQSFSKFIFVILTVTFAMFTFFTPEIPLFEDPITKTFGL